MGMDNLKNIRALVSDVDGVMTSGEIYVGITGETKIFSVRDGMGIKLFQKVGHEFALLSGRASEPVQKRAAELAIRSVKTGRLDKQTALLEIESEIGIPLKQMAYIGDDLPDLAPLAMVGVGFCPANATEEVKAAADIIIPVDGGKGVVRYAIEQILKAQNLWQECVRAFEVQK